MISDKHKLYVELGLLAAGMIYAGFSGPAFAMPVKGRFTSGFGMRKDPLNPSKLQGHNGQDIAVPIGTPVKAPRAGTIKNTTPSVNGGLQVVMVHDNGWFTGYAHLSKVLVKPGQKVKKGEVIALSGNTGAHTTGAHLHVTIKKPDGTLVDPKRYLK